MEIWLMNYSWLAIFAICMAASCNTRTMEKKTMKEKEQHIVPSFSFEESPVDFTVSDSLGFSMTFHKQIDSISYHSMRFRKPDSVRQLLPLLPTLASLWSTASAKIDIQLTSINIGYPLEYDDVLTNHIKAFAQASQWTGTSQASERIDYAMVAQVMYRHNIFPLYELLADFGYEITGFSIEKVGFAQPDKLDELGFDKSLKIPVPYMVWIQVAQTH